MRARAAAFAVLGVLVAACAGSSPFAEAPQRDELPAAPPAASAAPEPGPATCSEDLSDPPASPTKTSPAEPRRELALLLPPKAAAPKPIAKSVDLKRVAVRLPECVLPYAQIDLSPLPLPPSVPRADLPADLHKDWDDHAATKVSLYEAQVRSAKLERKRADCERERCAKRACLDQLHAAAASRAKTLRKELVAREESLVAKLAAAPKAAGTSLALGHLRERAVKRGDGDIATEMKPAIADYEEAKSKSSADTDIGWFARYLLALAYDEVGLSKQARAEWSLLSGAPPRAGTAEVYFRVGDHEPDPARAIAAFERALARASAEGTKFLRAAISYRLLRAESAAGRFVEAATTAASLLDLARDDEDFSLTSETIDELAFALDALGEAATGLPSIPESEWKRVASSLAREAFARFDATSAAVAEKAIGERGGAELRATGATTLSAADASPRMSAAARSCGFLALGSDGGEIDVRVEARSEGRARVTVKKRTGDAQIDAAAACLARRAPAYFVGAPTGATATIVYLSK